MTRSSIFDVVPLQRDFRQFLGSTFEGNQHYRKLRRSTPALMRFSGKTLRVIKEEVKRYTFGENMFGRVKSERDALVQNYSGKFEQFVRDYEACWKEHDEHSIRLGLFTDEFRLGRVDEAQFAIQAQPLLKIAIENDIRLHLYTFALQQMLEREIKNKDLPVMLPFEFYLNEDALILSDVQFASKYTYGDVNYARDLKRVVSPVKKLSELEDISELGYRSFRMSTKSEDFCLLNRLAHWEAYEEPRRRFSVTYGIFDYFFRETLFRQMHSKGIIGRGVSCALDIPVENFLKYSEDNSKDATK